MLSPAEKCTYFWDKLSQYKAHTTVIFCLDRVVTFEKNVSRYPQMKAPLSLGPLMEKRWYKAVAACVPFNMQNLRNLMRIWAVAWFCKLMNLRLV